ncbi:Secreted lipase [Cladobotryum mycophilum]|uniref:Carboxylic ester hydrolase n=1 Tax=Cladobotryum mycophilum TaxID=491253 RepID=A0ABR0SD01_9HYPO
MRSISPMVTAIWLAAAGVAATNPSVFDCKYNVTYTGISRNSTEAFLGIPYGQDTGGQNRFKPPRAYLPARGSNINATAIGAGCPQDPNGSFAGITLPGGSNISEDCLNLNVVRPNGTTESDRHPVMVWIYGGGFWSGRATEFYTTPDALIAQSVANGLPVIHVAMNYRLGVFGFAQSGALKKEGSENAGLRDQRLAIEWIRDNIEYFGGDANKITIFGQSSGGLSVGLQIMAYGGKKKVPFQQAICESQALETGITGDFTINAMKDVLNHLKIKSDLNSADAVASLRKLDMGTLLNTSIATYTDAIMDGDIWLPVVDGDFIPDAPSKLITEGRFGKVKTMIGWCQDDETLLTNTTIKTAEETRQTLANFAPTMSTANLDKLLALYPSSEFHAGTNLSAEFYRTARIKRDILMTCQPIYYGQHLAAHGNDVYLYNWNQTFLDKFFASFPTLPFPATESDFKLADRASRTWSTFASVGKPGLPGRDTFQGFTPAFAKKGNVEIFIAGGRTRVFRRLMGRGRSRR